MRITNLLLKIFIFWTLCFQVLFFHKHAILEEIIITPKFLHEGIQAEVYPSQHIRTRNEKLLPKLYQNLEKINKRKKKFEAQKFFNSKMTFLTHDGINSLTTPYYFGEYESSHSTKHPSFSAKLDSFSYHNKLKKPIFRTKIENQDERRLEQKKMNDLAEILGEKIISRLDYNRLDYLFLLHIFYQKISFSVSNHFKRHIRYFIFKMDFENLVKTIKNPTMLSALENIEKMYTSDEEYKNLVDSLLNIKFKNDHLFFEKMKINGFFRRKKKASLKLNMKYAISNTDTFYFELKNFKKKLEKSQINQKQKFNKDQNQTNVKERVFTNDDFTSNDHWKEIFRKKHDQHENCQKPKIKDDFEEDNSFTNIDELVQNDETNETNDLSNQPEKSSINSNVFQTESSKSTKNSLLSPKRLNIKKYRSKYIISSLNEHEKDKKVQDSELIDDIDKSNKENELLTHQKEKSEQLNLQKKFDKNNLLEKNKDMSKIDYSFIEKPKNNSFFKHKSNKISQNNVESIEKSNQKISTDLSNEYYVIKSKRKNDSKNEINQSSKTKNDGKKYENQHSFRVSNINKQPKKDIIQTSFSKSNYKKKKFRNPTFDQDLFVVKEENSFIENDDTPRKSFLFSKSEQNSDKMNKITSEKSFNDIEKQEKSTLNEISSKKDAFSEKIKQFQSSDAKKIWWNNIQKQILNQEFDKSEYESKKRLRKNKSALSKQQKSSISVPIKKSNVHPFSSSFNIENPYELFKTGKNTIYEEKNSLDFRFQRNSFLQNLNKKNFIKMNNFTKRDLGIKRFTFREYLSKLLERKRQYRVRNFINVDPKMNLGFISHSLVSDFTLIVNPRKNDSKFVELHLLKSNLEPEKNNNKDSYLTDLPDQRIKLGLFDSDSILPFFEFSTSSNILKNNEVKSEDSIYSNEIAKFKEILDNVDVQIKDKHALIDHQLFLAVKLSRSTNKFIKNKDFVAFQKSYIENLLKNGLVADKLIKTLIIEHNFFQKLINEKNFHIRRVKNFFDRSFSETLFQSADKNNVISEYMDNFDNRRRFDSLTDDQEEDQENDQYQYNNYENSLLLKKYQNDNNLAKINDKSGIQFRSLVKDSFTKENENNNIQMSHLNLYDSEKMFDKIQKAPTKNILDKEKSNFDYQKLESNNQKDEILKDDKIMTRQIQKILTFFPNFKHGDFLTRFFNSRSICPSLLLLTPGKLDETHKIGRQFYNWRSIKNQITVLRKK